ncbi:MAG: efflux RND transporter periplasmic adaptor subunit [Reyranella sp.]|uniref:efflux RND transporter periplasmic adaptor subunit n=1 Tax=Reyranella sp. TaxID=1929291 RepID=UPI00120139E4|nr:efflux RND transporter periplasmic adaptor subunit [Reyranella sp.]TAJ91277.1 MAG: efflux RND transporter periplasmic adaptor subunit [Reyranella sp.]TBR28193.1 MAG: efflux RND transporter periplasmic adaptor subunit [Reyranella sp.]
MKYRRSTASMLVAAALWAACSAAPALAQQPGAPPPAVLVQAAEMKPIADQAEFIGRAAAVDKVELRARVKGFLGPRKFADGDQVKKDQVVFTIEPETYQAAVDQKKAQLDAARAGLANAETQLKRAAELLRTSTGTQVTYDQRLAEQLQAKAQVEDSSAQLRDAELQLSYTEIKSPIDGRIGRAAFSPGNLVSPDSGVLATIVSENPIRVLFSVTQRELLDARRDQATDPNGIAVRIRLADGSIYKEKGKIDFIDNTVDAKTDGQIVRATFPNPDGMLTDGQTLRVIIEGEQVPTSVAVPQAAIAQDQTGAYLFVVNDKNVVEQKRVRTGVSRDGMVAITSGLKAGERVIVQGQQRVRPGMTVNPSVAPPSASTQKQ